MSLLSKLMNTMRLSDEEDDDYYLDDEDSFEEERPRRGFFSRRDEEEDYDDYEEPKSRISIHKALTGLDGNFYQFFPTFLQFSKHNASFFSFNSPPYPKSPYFLCPLSRFFKCEYSNLSMSTSHPH